MVCITIGAQSMNKPKILLFDIETSPNLAYVWGKYQQDVIAFKKERELLSFAYKWIGESKIHCYTKEHRDNDFDLVAKLTQILNQADMVIFHNGHKFDRKVVRTRALYHNIAPHKTAASIDTCKVARERFGFNGNSLDDLCRYLELGRKLPNKGIDLWLGCMKDDPKSWTTMRKYNIHDVILLERVYKRMRPWIEDHPSMKSVDTLKTLAVCPNCRSKNSRKQGIRAAATTLKQQWQCTECGRWYLTRLERRK